MVPDEYNTEWHLWAEIRAERAATLPALDWDALNRVHHTLRANGYTRAQRQAFWRSARAGKWARDVLATCADPNSACQVWHTARTYFVVTGRNTHQAMERAA